MKLNLIAPINPTSYGLTGTHLVDELIKMGIEVSLFPIGSIGCDTSFDQTVGKALDNSRTYDKNASCVRLFHQFDLAQFVGHGKHIGFPIFELDKFNELEKHHLSSCDELLVCSQWAKDIIQKNLPNTTYSIKIVPLGVDTDQFKAIIHQGLRRQNTIFINVGKWEVRKGHDILVGWFNEAFTENDNVELWLMNYNMFYTDEQNKDLANKAKRSKLGSKISIIPYQKSLQSLISIMKQVDCGVFPARAEGWNLEILELMALGKNIITTNYSGHTEFCSRKNSILVDVTSVEPAYGKNGFDDKWFRGQGNWAKLDNTVRDQFIQHMRNIHNLKQSGALNPNIEGIETAKRFSWKNSAQKLMEAVCT